MQQNTRIGRYIVDRRVGAGGMAVTYLCRLDGIGGFQKLVLVKMLHTRHLSDEAYIQMFLDEARLGALLHHPNISQVFEIGEQDGAPFFVMEYVPGPNLAKVVKKLGSPEERPYGHFAGIMASVARALDFAHSLTDDNGKKLNVIHRDVSLGNILIAPTGVAKLIDFGIAKWEMKKNVTEVGMIKGKLHYMAPEQLSDSVDHRVDIYQAGVCLYWCCTGTQPFLGEDAAQVWRDRLVGRVRKPSEVVADIPPALEAIILKAMEPSAQDRYQSAGEMAEALDNFCASDPAWRTGERELSGFLKGLFSDEEMANYRAGHAEVTRTNSQSNTGISSITAHTASQANPVSDTGTHHTGTQHTGTHHTGTQHTGTQHTGTLQGPSQRRNAMVWAVTGALLALGAVLMATSDGGSGEAPTPVAEALVDASASARTYIEAAEAAVTAHSYGEAREYLAKARAAGSGDASLDIRMSKLERMLERTDKLAEGRRALASGDARRALDIGYVLQDINPEDEDAKALIREAIAANEPVEQPPAPVEGPSPTPDPPRSSGERSGTNDRHPGPAPKPAPPPPPPASGKTGSLEVASPYDAVVSIDGAGRFEVPFSRVLPVGDHTLLFTRDGFIDREVKVTIVEGRTVSSNPSMTEKEAPQPKQPEDPKSSEPPPPEKKVAAVVPAGSALAASVAATSDKEVEDVLASVEHDAQRRGVDPRYAVGITRGVYNGFLNMQPPPDVYNLRPAAMSDAIVKGFAANTPADAMRKSLTRTFVK